MIARRPPSRTYYLLVAAVLAAAVVVRFADPFFVRALRLIAFDIYQRIAPESYDPRLPVRIVDIDQASLDRLGQWPWPRTKLRDLVVALGAKQAAAIAFDIAFAEPDRLSPERIAKELPSESAALLSPALAALPDHDAAFAQALRETPSVLGLTLTDKTALAIAPKAQFAFAGDDPKRFVPRFAGAGGVLPRLAEAAAGLGATNWLPERDQIVRRAGLVYQAGDVLIPSLAVEALRVAQRDITTFIVKASNASGETAFGQATGINHLKVGEWVVATEGDGGVALRFRRTNPDAFLPAWKVLAGEVAEEEIAGAIVLVGSSEPGLHDVWATPLDVAVPGVEIQAQVIEHILAGRSLRRPDFALGLEQFLIVAFGFFLAVLQRRLSAAASAAFGGATILVLLAGGWTAYAHLDLLLDPLYPALALGGMTSATTVYVYRQAETQRGEIRSAFGRYLAPEVVEEIIADPQRLRLGGEVRELTLIFCDVRNFTGIAERLDPTELTRFVNELLTPLSEAILERRGTIDKYMGDAIMAFWNAPLADSDHARHACDAALEMASALVRLNQGWAAQAAAAGRDFVPVRMGIGLNAGPCCVGNLGSTLRFDYSAIGDEVNVTARLEGIAKLFGLTAVVAEQVLAKAPGFAMLELDTVRLQGRMQPTRVFTFWSLLDRNAARFDAFRPLQERFLAAYRRQRWEDARRHASECRGFGVEGLAVYYSVLEARIDSLAAARLPGDWNGVHDMTEK